MYMRLLGYPAEKIAILTTYNGQKHLIRDVIKQRCADNPLIGRPSKVGRVTSRTGSSASLATTAAPGRHELMFSAHDQEKVQSWARS